MVRRSSKIAPEYPLPPVIGANGVPPTPPPLPPQRLGSGSLAAVWPRGEVQLLPLPNPPGVRVPPPPARQPSGSGPPRLVWTADSRSVVLPPGMHAHASAPLPPPPQLWQPRATAPPVTLESPQKKPRGVVEASAGGVASPRRPSAPPTPQRSMDVVITTPARAAPRTSSKARLEFPSPAAGASSAPRGPALRLWVGTWNMHGKAAPASLEPWLPARSVCESSYDLMVVGTQEAERSIEKSMLNPSKAKWEAALAAALGDGFALVGSHTLAAIHLAVYARDSLLPLVSRVRSAHVATGFANTFGNKGGVAVALSVGGTSLLFVNAHFAAHQHKVKERNADFARIDARLLPQLEPPPPAGSHDDDGAASSCSARFDRCFWLGDFNYRINGNRAAVDALLAPPSERARASEDWGGEAAHDAAMRAALLANDQLRLEMARGAVFGGFLEGAIDFRPTYKFDARDKAVYDLSEKRRVPAYTDRVLWRRCDAVALKAYASCDELRTSDHRPVHAEFDVGYDAAPDGGGVPPEVSMVRGSARFGNGVGTHSPLPGRSTSSGGASSGGASPAPSRATPQAQQSAMCAIL